MSLLLNAEIYAPERLRRRCLLVAGGRIGRTGDEIPTPDHTLGTDIFGKAAR